MLEPVAQLVACKDRGTQLREVLVAAGVIRVHVCVDQEADGLVGDATDRGDELVGERRELGVDQQDALGARQHADRAALAFQGPEVGCQLGGPDLDLAEVGRRLRERGGARERQRGGGERRGEGVHFSPVS
jgi:hypothetical protein